MTKLEISNLHQTAVLWAATGVDATFGTPTTASPTEISCRYEKSNGELMNPKNERVATVGTMMVDLDVAIGSILWIGTHDVYDATASPVDYLVVVGITTIPDIKNRSTRRVLRLSSSSDTPPTLT